MKHIILIFYLFMVNCSDNVQIFRKNELEIIIKSYINKNNNILNDCNSQPFYKIYFYKNKDSIGFWIGAHLGLPSLVVPIRDGVNISNENIQIKGTLMINKYKIVVYDYDKSCGYGLYNISDLKVFNINDFEVLPDKCTNVWYPEALFYKITEDSIYVTDKRKAFKLK